MGQASVKTTDLYSLKKPEALLSAGNIGQNCYEHSELSQLAKVQPLTTQSS
jgi:hypothetical protein